jgi:SAM-dependent methyltransferase
VTSANNAGSDKLSVEESVAINRQRWTAANAEYTDAAALDAWRAEEIRWGVWHIPERQLHALPCDPAGLDVVELGCGTAYVSAWLARRGARVVGVDPTPAQLATARRCQLELALEFPLVEAPGERVPLPDASFDLVISEYGASIWADPYCWIPEASRLLRDNRYLVFLRNSTLAILCAPDVGRVGERLVRRQFGMHQFDWRSDNDGIGYHLAHGEWIRLLRDNSFEILNLLEIQAPPDAQDAPPYDFVPAEWAQQWPSEEIWVAQKKARVRDIR